MLYVAPETLTKQENLEFFSGLPLSFFAVDEAHCISEWGHDFRPEYRRLREMMVQINPDIPIIALTATATQKYKVILSRTWDCVTRKFSFLPSTVPTCITKYSRKSRRTRP